MATQAKAHAASVRSFFAGSVQEAIDIARQQMGPDALLLNSRSAPPEGAHLGAFEVVFGEASLESSAARPSSLVTAEVDELRVRVDEIKELLLKGQSSATYSRGHESVIERSLIDAGIDIELAREIDYSVRRRISERSVIRIGSPRVAPVDEAEALMPETLAEIHSRFEVAPKLERITALIGPPGVGKTTTIAKLAVREGLAVGRSVRLISADTQRIGGSEQLQTYANILGVPFQAVETIAALRRAIEGAPEDCLQLIDMPGYSAGMLKDIGADMATFLSHRQDIDIQLVLTASMRPVDLRNTSLRFAVFNPSKLLFTKLDETSTYASVFCEAVIQAKPVSFICGGQSVPEDIEAADKQRVAVSLVARLPGGVEAVA